MRGGRNILCSKISSTQAVNRASASAHSTTCYKAEILITKVYSLLLYDILPTPRALSHTSKAAGAFLRSELIKELVKPPPTNNTFNDILCLKKNSYIVKFY